MKDVIYLLYHLLTTIAKLIQPGGSRAVMAKNRLLKQQLIIHGRSRQRERPIKSGGDNIIDIRSYEWKMHCRSLFQLPVAAWYRRLRYSRVTMQFVCSCFFSIFYSVSTVGRVLR